MRHPSFLFSTAAALLFLGGSALASTGNDTVRYRFEHEARVDAQVLKLDPVHHDGSIALRWRLDADCDVQITPAARDLTCAIDQARLTTENQDPVRDGIPGVRRDLERATVEASLDAVGHLTHLDVQLPDASPSPMLRFVVERSFAGLDLPVKQDSVWSERDTRLVPQPGSQGAVAHVRALHWVERGGDTPLIGTHGRVSWMPRATVVEPGSTLKGEVRGRARLDTRGRVLERRWTTTIGDDGFSETGSVRQLLDTSS